MKLSVADTKVVGCEPLFIAPINDENDIQLAVAYNWYSYFYDPFQTKDWAVSFIKRHKKHAPEVVRCFEQTTANAVPNWLGAVARMDERGVNLPDSLIQRAHTKCYDLAKSNFIGVATTKSISPIYIKHSPKASEVILSIDACLDDFYMSQYTKFDCDVYKILSDVGVPKGQTQIIHDYYSGIMSDLNAVLVDKVVWEAYDHLKPKQLKAYRGVLEKILADIQLYMGNKTAVRKVRKPRKRKEKSPLKLVAKVKYCEQFEPLKLVSVHPSQIIGASAVWLYNHKYNTLAVLKAAGPSGLTIKGTTVLNIGEDSECKKVRKPDGVIPKVLSGGKVSLRNLLSELNTKPLEPKGRLGSDTVILRTIR